MAHTPGPWQCRPTHRMIGEFIVGAIDCDMMASDATADAMLIAAAPDLLAALRDMVMLGALMEALAMLANRDPDEAQRRKVMCNALTAIAKAEGR